jgi:hypothetical protein
MKTYLLLGFALVALICGQPSTASAAQSTAQLVAMQPPPNGSGADRFAMDVNCNLWAGDQTAVNECAKDMDLIKGLGVGTVRLGTTWDMMTQDGTLDPKKVAFTKSLLNAARTRGMKILFEVGMLAPAGAYKCAGVQNPPTESSPRLDFCDTIFKQYFSAMMDVVLPYTPDIELFNELNWGFSRDEPSYGAVNGIYGYIAKREQQLYIMAQQILKTKAQQGYKTVLHTQGISYFYNSQYPNDGWTPSNNAPFIQATDNIKNIGDHTTAATSTLNSSVDVVDIHPYFKASIYVTMVQSVVDTLAKLSPNGAKPLWITETNNGIDGSDAGMTAAFNQLKIVMDRGLVQKAFWYVVRNGDPGNGEGDGYSIYDYNRNLIRPQLASAIKAYMATIPSSSRFLSGAYLTPIQ